MVVSVRFINYVLRVAYTVVISVYSFVVVPVDAFVVCFPCVVGFAVGNVLSVFYEVIFLYYVFCGVYKNCAYFAVAMSVICYVLYREAFDVDIIMAY